MAGHELGGKAPKVRILIEVLNPFIPLDFLATFLWSMNLNIQACAILSSACHYFLGAAMACRADTLDINEDNFVGAQREITIHCSQMNSQKRC
jgi:hypothetical protein